MDIDIRLIFFFLYPVRWVGAGALEVVAPNGYRYVSRTCLLSIPGLEWWTSV